MKLAVSIGCPSGIGPEVSIVAAAALRGASVLLVGDEGAVRRAMRARAVPQGALVRVATPSFVRGRVALYQPGTKLAPADRAPGAPTRAGGAAQLRWIDVATDLVRGGHADALVTGPVSKEAIASSGAPGAKTFRGHTEHLQARLGADEVVMAFAATEGKQRLVTALATTHLALVDVPRRLDRAAVARATFWLAWLVDALGERSATLAVASLNPHAGEGGLLGREEARVIVPGMRAAAARMAKAELAVKLAGPVPAESAYRRAVRGDFAGVVAMYHDQATIPMKLVSFGEAVNVSLGLPIVRTSVDHGTGYDRAARFDADAHGMTAALKLGAKLAGRAVPTGG
jgi:4-hydroxythreonine-4-phosphate dehydrogenase